MSKENQIEEMARDIFAPKVAIDGIDIAFAAVHGADKPDSHFMRIAQHLYNAGYRKQSEGEIFEEIEKAIDNSTVVRSFDFGRAYFAISQFKKDIAEFKKKYTGDQA